MKKDYTNQTLIKGSFAFNCLLPIIQFLSVQIKDFSLFYFYNRKNKWIHYVSSIFTLLLLTLLNNAAKAQVSGKVFKDFNANATQEATAVFTEPGIAGVTVTAYNAAGASVGTATTAADGSYSIAGASGALRIEFSNFPVGIYEGPAGSGNKTSVQFVTAPTTTASLGINCPEDYCNTANPKLVTVCYDNGSGVGNTNPVVVDLNYTDTGTGLNAYPTNGTADNMGSVWGVAYDKKTKLSYFSAFLKRQAGLGDRGLDGIYVINYATATPTLVGGFDLEGVVPANGGAVISFGSVTRNLIASGTGIGTNDLSADRTKASRDADAYGKVGKVGYGDIDIDQAKNTLWAVNLNERSLIAVDISSNIHGATIPTTAAAAKVKRYFIDGATAPFISGMATCPNGTMRPFGLKIYKDKGYLGTVCDGSSLTTVDLTVSQKAYVYSFDLANPTSFTEVTSVPLNYNREQSWVPFAPTTTFDALESDQWQRWIDTYTDPTTFGSTVNSTNADFKTGINGTFVGAPQPILSDIEFLPNGDMVLGFMDRFAHQQGWANLIPASTTVLRNAVSHGDILLASKTTTGFVFEGPNENDNFTTPAVSAAAQPGQELNDGPSGAGEFFYTDYFIGSDATHPETALGGLAILPGSNEITAISFDPAAFNSMGVRWMNHNTGVQSRVYTIVSGTGISNFGKGSGLGDVELLCNLAPIEIGNRVWKDTDKDGIQDPGEPALVGVRVVLYNSSNVAVDTAITDLNGNYYFSSALDPDVKANTSYKIKVVSMGADASVAGLVLTDVTNAPGETSGQNTGATLANNDAFLSSNIPTILFTTGDWGENNHSLDFGFMSCTKPSLTFTVKQPTCTNGTINKDGLLTINPVGADKVGLSYGGTSYAGPTYANASTDFVLELPNTITDSTKIWIRVFAGLNNAACIKDTSFILPPTPCAVPKPCNAGPGQIGGNIFRDFNNTGTKDSLEIGLAGVQVKVYDCFGKLLATTTTDKFGNYSFAGMPSSQVRVEFGALPAPLVATKAGADNGTTTQFVTAPDCTVDLGVNDPTDYCQNDPFLVTTCFVNGDPLLGGTTGKSDYMVAWDYYPAANKGVNKYVAEGTVIGTTWGIAYDRIDKKLFTSAFLKRHAGLGVGGSGAIYSVDMKDTANITTALFVDLQADFGINVGADPRTTSGQALPANKNVANHDSLAFSLIGKMSLGDIDISEDQRTLWVTNLKDRTLIELPINSPATKPTTFKVHNLPNPGCVNGVFRVFATKTYKGDVYVGGVCTAENGGTAADLKAIIYKHNALGAASSFTEVLNFPLNYPRGYVSYNGGANPPQFVNAEWNPWISKIDDIPVADQHAVYNQVMHPQPMLSDIEMDVNGDMIITFSDRIGHQFGNANWGTSKADTVVGYEATAAGDILRASLNGTTYTLENNGTAGNITTVGANEMVPIGGQGPGGGEYYWQDIYTLSSNPNSTGGHQEISNGSLVLLPGTNEVVSTVFDPLSEYRAAGVRYYNNTTGNMSRGYQIFGQDGGIPNVRLETFAKGANLGDLEALCDMEPIEIGNRLWLDLNNDGVQDPCETPIANVSVSLYDKLGNLIAQTTTDANGNYYFNETNVVDTLGLAKPNFLGPQPTTDYFVVVGKENGSFNKTTSFLTAGSSQLNLTVANSTLSNGNDQNDSDAQLTGIAGLPASLNGYPVIAVKTPSSGSNHTFDVGFSCKPKITATPKKQIICGTGTASAFTRKVITGFVSSQQWYGPLADTTSAFGTAIAGAVDSTYTPTTLPAAGQTKYYAVVARNGDALCSDTAFVALSVSPKIVLKSTPSNALCNAGGGSITTTVTGGTTPYTYLWSNAATTPSLTAVAIGSYKVTVTDAGGCTADTTIVLTEPDSMSLSLNAMNVSCNAGTNGALMSIVSGGKAGYTYEWNGTTAIGLFFSNDPTVANLLAGTYSLKVTDANGCTKTKNIVLTQPIAINIAQTAKSNICFDQSKGEIYVAAGGGVSPYTITWKVNGVVNPAFNGKDTLRNLVSGIYELTLKDANGCSIVEADTIKQPAKLVINYTKINGVCANGNKGSINSIVTGGVAPYAYAWSNGVSVANVSNLVSGNYKLVVTDAKNCKDSINVFVDEQDCRVDVALKKTVDGICERKAGDLVTFNIVVSRKDTTTQTTTVIVKDQIAAEFLVTSSTATKGTFDASTGLWSGINLAKGDSAVLTVKATIKATASGLLCNQAYVDFMDKIDIDSQAGNLNPVEDDIAYACVSVPINLCQADGNSATLTTPDSLANIKWFKNGIELTAEAGKSTITVTTAGSYTYTGTSNGTLCQVGNCCPVIIKDACYGSIGDYVWNDNNINGKQDAGETPVSGVKVYLLDGTTGAKLDSTITDANGKYLFDSLLTSTYKVQFVEPAGKDFTTFNTGGDTTKDSDAGVNGISGLITIDTTKPSTDILRNNPTIDAGIIPQFGSIGDYVWTDKNNDGQQSAGETPIAGVKVYLYDATGISLVVLDSTVTDANGKYLFDSLLSSRYVVQFVAPAGTISAKQNTGADVTDSDANKLGFSQVITINTALLATDTLRNNPQIDAGFVPVGSLGDYVFADKDNSNTQTAGDIPVAGVTVYLLDGTTGAKLDSTLTDANGKYLFDSLLAGTYKVQFVAPTGTLLVSKAQGGDPTKDSNPNPATGITDAVVIDTTQPLGSVARDNMTVDAGIKDQLQYGSIGDLVWIDQNGNGQQDGTESKMAGIKIYLYDGTGTTKLDSTVSDANGKYLFDSLITGSYKVKFVVPAGLILTKQYIGNEVSDSDANNLGFSQVINIDTSLPGTDTLRNNPQIDVGFIPVGSLGDYVFIDKNGNGTQEATDTPIAGIKVYLLDGTTGAKLDSTLTDANGKYLFDSLLAGTYKVKFVIPVGSEATTKSAGADTAKDSNINPDGTTDAVTIDTTLPVGNVGRDNPTIDAGIKPAYGSIGDYVWSDKNNDGQQSAGELPIAGVKVYLYNAAGTVKLDSTVTDANGKYLFDSLLTGAYKVKFVAPTGTIASKQNVGADVSDSDANKLGFSQVVNINTALLATDTLRNNPQIDAGFVPVGSIGDYVFIDKNGNGTQEATDTPIAGIKVYLLDGTTGAKLDSTLTDANGKYLFDSLLAGTYKVKFVIPAGSEATTKTVGADTAKDSNINPDGTTDAVTIDTTLPVGNVGRDNPTIDAGIKPAYGSIGDYVWTDQNNDGQQSAGELPIAGVKVYLYNGAGTVKLDSTVTDANGKYLFDSLLTGSYKVKFVAPVGTSASKQNVGADVTDSDANKLGFSQVVNINTALLATDTLRNNPQIDAGFVPVGSLGDYVFADKNGNGTQEATDTPIAGIKVYLLDGTTGAKLDSTVTDANGKYLFDSLFAGTYKVKFVIPVGSEATTKSAGADTAKDSNINPDGTTDVVTIDTTLPVGNVGRDNPTIDAGIKPAYGSIGDYVWSDKNNDGQQSAGELPIAGVKVYLYNAAGTVKRDSTVTDANGKYLFDSLLTSAYKVKFVAPTGTIASKQNVGADVTDSDANKLGFSQVVNINTALLATDTLRNNPQIDAGFVPVGSLGDYVWFDLNKDGLQTSGEPVVKGIKVYLTDDQGVILDSTKTDANGKYLFDSLLAGNYKVKFVAPKDTNFTVQGTSLLSGLDSNPNTTTGLTDAVTIDTTKPVGDPARDNRSVDAGLTVNLGSIAGKTFDDNDKSGTQNTGDTDHPSVKVYLYKETTPNVYAVVDSVITDSQGNYKFNNLISGNYQVQFNKPTGTIFTTSNVGDDTKDSDANTTTGRTGVIPINTNLPETYLGRNSKYNDAGFTPLAPECKTEICIPFEIKKVRK